MLGLLCKILNEGLDVIDDYDKTSIVEKVKHSKYICGTQKVVRIVDFELSHGNIKVQLYVNRLTTCEEGFSLNVNLSAFVDSINNLQTKCITDANYNLLRT
jgi:hypothetical protein